MSPFSQQIKQRVADFIAREHLLPPSISEGEICYVGLSGGPDSVALLHLLHSLGYQCHALHCNFHLRGAESDRDQHFCEQLCGQLSIPITVKEFDTHQYMAEQHLSLEMAARQLRYQWWQEVANGPIALGHHQDDSIETLLINLLRGTGIQGLTGIVAHNASTHVVRPLLCLSRQEIISYLSDVHLTYVTDSTNAECDTLRNELRNHLIPRLQEAVPQCRQGIINTISHLQGSSAFADLAISEIDKKITVTRSQWGITWEELPLEALHTLLPDTHLHAHFIFEWKRRHSSSTTQIVSTSSLLYTRPTDPNVFDILSPNIQKEIVSAAIGAAETTSQSSSTNLSETFDIDTLQLPLTLRRWQEGDRISPLGMQSHSKLLSDLMSNAHYTPMQKATTWVVTDATGSILWAIGLRISDLHKVTTQTTTLLKLSVL